MIQHGDHVVEFVDDYLHELLSEVDAQYVREHAERCAICQTALEEAKKRLALLRSTPAMESSETLIGRTMERVREQSRRMTTRQLAWRAFAIAMAAAIAIVSILHVYFLTASPTPYDLRVVAQPEMMSDTQGSLRAVVMRGDNGAMVRGAKVRIELLDTKSSRRVELASFTTDDQGSGEPRFRLPDWQDGNYELTVTADPGSGREAITRQVKLRRSWKLMLSSDKPVYQPGQTMHFRALALRQPDLKPVAGREAVFSITDPKGNVIFKSNGVTSRFGITSTDCALADEITEGSYSIQCVIGGTESRQTVEVKKYVLPKFRIDADLDKPYYQPGQRMKLSIRAGYFFGKPVAGGVVEVEIRDGATIEKRTIQTDQSGLAELEMPIAQTLTGRPQDNGDARILIDVLVRDSAGQEQRRSVSRVVTASPLRVEVVPESGELTQGIANKLYLLTTYADGTPASARVSVSGLDTELRTGELGAASFEITPSTQQLSLTVRATDDQGLTTTRQVSLKCGQVEGDFVVRTEKSVYRGGQTMKIVVLGGGDEPVFADLVKEGQTLLTQTIAISKGRGEHQVDLPADVFGTVTLSAYRLNEQGLAVRKSRVLYIEPAQQLKLQVGQDQTEYRPGGQAKLSFELTDSSGKATPGAISLAAVDEAVFSVMDQVPGMERTFFTLEQEMLKPIYSLYNWSPDLSGSGSDAQRAELERALFARASAQPNARMSQARAILEKAVSDGDLDRHTLEVLDEPNAAAILKDGWIDEPIRSMLQEAAAQGMSVQSTYPSKVERADVLKHEWLEVMYSAWGVLFVLTVVAGIVRLAEAAGASRVFAVLFFILFGMCLVSIMMPSLNRARETANRVKSAADMRSLGQALMLAQNEPVVRKNEQNPGQPRLRQWFPETLLWRPELITDEQGRATLNLDLADSITTWRLSASAVSAQGQLGAIQSGIRVFQPFFVDMNLPVALTRNDEIILPVTIYSYLDRAQTVELTLDRQSDWFELLDEPVKRVELQAGEVRSASYRLRVKRVGLHDLQITARGEGVADAVKRMIEVIPDGRRIEQIANGTLAQPVDLSLSLPSDATEGSGKLFVKLYPSSFSQLVEGLEGIFQRPYGCFEQTSSTTYPNILALTYLKQTKKSVPEVEARAREYIHLGYQRLVGFEVSGGGFDWFGRPPANVLLTAYGLMEFEDMQQVYDVDPKLLDRTRAWLLSQRNADGTWSAGNTLNDGLAGSVMRGADPRLATTAYVAWSVYGSTQNRAEALSTLDYLRRQPVDRMEDPYILAVLANAMVSMDRYGPATGTVLRRLASLRQISADGKQAWWAQPEGGRTAFYGAGNGGSVETTALAALAMIRSGENAELTRGALSWLISRKDSSGTWPSTQATVLALKALLAGTGKPLGGDAPRTIRLTMGNGFNRQVTIPVDQSEVMQQVDLSAHLRAGANTVALDEPTGGASGYQIAFRYHTPAAPLPGTEPLSIAMEYDRTELSVGQSINATATITNRMAQAAPMIILDVPIPAGFEVDLSEFDRMQAGGSIAKYQVNPRSVVVYLRSLSPASPLIVRYRLTATMPVKITAPPAKVYEYYDPSKSAESSPKALTVAGV